MKRTKILYGVEAAQGGVLKHLMYLVSNLDSERFDITVVLSDLRGNVDKEIAFMREHNARVMKLSMKRSINLFSDVAAFIKILFLLRGRYDVVHAHSSKAGALFCLAAWIGRVPRIYYTPHCFFFQGKKGLTKSVFVLIERLIGLFYSSVIVSDNEQLWALKHRITVSRKIKNINNAINFGEYLRVERQEIFRKQLGVGPKDILIGAIGRLTLQKDWFTYVYVAKEVVATNPNVKFLVVGDGELKDDIKHLIDKFALRDNVFLTGHIKDISKVFSSLDLFISTSRWEGLPYVFLEAMYYKLPIVATDTGNDTAIINGKTGYIVPLRDYVSIADHIRKLINDNVASTEMGLNALTHVLKKYSFKVFIHLHERLYLN